MKIKITYHARERLWERMKMRGSSAIRLARLAISRGLATDQASGQLARYMKNKSGGRASDRIWCGFYFVFDTRNDELILITVTDLPKAFKGVASMQIRKRDNEIDRKGQN